MHRDITHACILIMSHSDITDVLMVIMSHTDITDVLYGYNVTHTSVMSLCVTL
jgi:hypothetical protein